MSAHSLGHEESHWAIYRQSDCGPSPEEEVALRVQGMGAASPGPGCREASPAPPPAAGAGGLAGNWASAPISEGPRLGQARTTSPESTRAKTEQQKVVDTPAGLAC